MSSEWTETEKAMNLAGLLGVTGLPAREFQYLRELIRVWECHRSRNILRETYYEGKNKLKDLGISIPPALKNVETVVGWSAKAVDVLAARSRLSNFADIDGNADPFLSNLYDENQLDSLYSQAVTSQLIHSCSFMTVSNGDVDNDEPESIISAYSATNAAGIWNRRLKRLEAGLAVIELDNDAAGKKTIPVWVNLYTDKVTWELHKVGQKWTATAHPHKLGRPAMVSLRYRPTLDRPFGKSRIDRSVMSINDRAVRTALRSEVTSEFFTAPQKYLLGADDTTFEETSKWEAYIGNIFSVTENENGEIPHFGQLSQASMQPHSEYLRTLALEFSSATNIPVSELGIVSDNPSSAQAITAAKEPLIIDCQEMNALNRRAIETLSKAAICLSEDKSPKEIKQRLSEVHMNFVNPAFPSVVSMADSIVKAVAPAGAAWAANTNTYWKLLGFDEATIAELEQQKAAIQAQQMAMAFAQQGAKLGEA